jgi:CubicO group peptidase (beta-lactamase class C family)
MRIAALLAVLCTVSTAHADARADKIMYLLGLQREQNHVAGIGVAVVLDGQVIVLDVRGMRDVAQQSPVSLDTLFPIGSCTKAFTALALGLARDEGLLSLDDSPQRWLPYFKMKDRETSSLITLRDMLSHRTGLRGYADLAAMPDVLTREDYLRAALGATPATRPRAAYGYSNAMVTAAGEVVARAYNTTWERVIETKILAPLGMTASRTSSYHLGKDGAIGYSWDGTTWKPASVAPGLRAMAPAGAIAASTRDMARWVRMLASGGVLDGIRFVSEATLRDLTSPHTKINDVMSYALGWAVYEWNGHRVLEHSGGSEGLSALVSFMPDRHSGFVILANSSPTQLTKVGALGAQLWPLILDESTRTPPPTTPSRATTLSPPPPAATQDLPTATDLIARAITAAGGRARLARHTSMQLRAVGAYIHQGVDIEITGTYHAGKRVLDEAWRAAGKRIGRVRTYFDGTRGAQQTTFGQDETFTGDAEALARRDAILHPLLDIPRLYESTRVDRKVVLDGEDAFVLVLTPKLGPPVELYISARTHLILRRDSDGESTRFSSFRTVDGEVVPFASTTTGPLGDKVLTIKQLRFNITPPARFFGPVAKLTR